MSLELRNGVYYVRLMIDGKRVQKSTKTGDEALAKRVHKQIMAELVLGKHNMGPKPSITFKEAFESAMRTHWVSKKDTTSPRISFNIVAGIIGEDKKLADVSEDTYEEIIAAMYDEGYAAGTINRKMSVLSKLMKLNERKLDMRLPRVPLQEEFAGRKRYLNDAEEKALYAALSARIKKHGGNPSWTHFNALVAFLIETGVRLGEALAARPGAVDHHSHDFHVWESKGNLSRTIPLTDAAYDAFVAVGGQFQVSKDQAEHMWRTVREDMGLAEDTGFVIHALRHTCCTRLLKSGMNVKMVQLWMGHKRIETTMIYAHLDTSDLHACRDSLTKKLYQRSTKVTPRVGLEAKPSDGHYVS